ncbi:hypothetical protein Btru_068813 [Bulinus truncatus]|nr:hypothetical protein Btru_068813 [Bulinus truncatus]
MLTPKPPATSVWWLCLITLVTVQSETPADEDVALNRGKGIHASPKPCCLPYRFQAIITPLATFSVENKVVSRLYRNWESRIQVHEQVTFTPDGLETSLSKFILDYKNKKQYFVNSATCSESPITSGMLEPCMPDNSVYLGKSYIGLLENTANFDAWYFKRTDQNRDIEMTIAVTSDRCVPIMEHITGRMGEGTTDTLVLFTNISEVVEESVFKIPHACLGNSLM